MRSMETSLRKHGSFRATNSFRGSPGSPTSPRTQLSRKPSVSDAREQARRQKSSIALHHSSLSYEQVVAASSLYNDLDEGTVGSIEQVLEELGLMKPSSYDLPNKLVALGIDPKSSYIDADVFLHIVNEVWNYYQGLSTENNLMRNAFDAVQVAEMNTNADGSDDLEDSYEAFRDEGDATAVDSEEVIAFQLPSKRQEAEDHFKGIDQERLEKDPIGTIIEASQKTTSFKNFSKLFHHQYEDPELVNAFTRLGAQKSDIGFFLDTDVLAARCSAAGLSDSEIRAVLNVFDEDSNGEVDFDEFCKVMVGDTLSMATINETVVQGLKKLLGRDSDGSNFATKRGKLNSVRNSGTRQSSARASATRMRSMVGGNGSFRGRRNSNGSNGGGGALTLLDCIDLSTAEMLDEMQNGEFTLQDERNLLEQLQDEITTCDSEVESLKAHTEEMKRIEKNAKKGAYGPFYNRRTGVDESPVAPTTPDGQLSGSTIGRQFPAPPDFTEMPLREAHPRHRTKKYNYVPAPPNSKSKSSTGVAPKYKQQQEDREAMHVAAKHTTTRPHIMGLSIPTTSSNGTSTPRSSTKPKEQQHKKEEELPSTTDSGVDSNDRSTASSAGGQGITRKRSVRRNQAYFKEDDGHGPAYMAPTRRGSHRYLEEVRAKDEATKKPGIETSLYEKILSSSPRRRGDEPVDSVFNFSPKKVNANGSSTKKNDAAIYRLPPLERNLKPPPVPELHTLPFAVKEVSDGRGLRDRVFPKTARVGDGGSVKEFTAAASVVYGPHSARIGPNERQKAKDFKPKEYKKKGSSGRSNQKDANSSSADADAAAPSQQQDEQFADGHE